MNFLCRIDCLPKTGEEREPSSSPTSVAPPVATPRLLDLPQNDMGFPDPSHPCYRFEHTKKDPSDISGEFYSPGYPDNYTSNTNCYLVLEAPPEHVIILDFREYFAIEQSPKCKNDYLEVRDGAYGFNRLMQNAPFCGFNFPPEMTSSDRHLWIHFKSDENIEYKGFKAVYRFEKRPAHWSIPEKMECRKDLEGVQGILSSKEDIASETTELSVKHKIPVDCVWVITVRKGWRIQLTFNEFHLQRPNDCHHNFLDIFSDRPDIPYRDKNFCGSIADTVSSKNNTMFVRFYTDTEGQGSRFTATFTAFKEIDKHSSCDIEDFDCDDGTCIAKELKCNQVNNCRFRWDEDEENCNNNKKMPLHEKHIVIIMVIFSLILSGMCFTFIFNCVKKIIRDHRAIQEYIRQSREHQLNEIVKEEQIEKKTKVDRSESISTHSSESHRFSTANAITNTPCYVPGGELLPILIRNEQSSNHSNPTAAAGDAYNTYDEDNPPAPEMCDSACQTRESLFTANAYSSGHSTPNHSITSAGSKPSPPAPFSTFGYKKENKYRAEARIEMEGVPPPATTRFEEKRRPYSVQTTKSAPDVIVTH